MARNPNAKRYKTATAFRIDADLMNRVGVFCQGHKLTPTRTAVVEAALREFLERYEEGSARTAATSKNGAVA